MRRAAEQQRQDENRMPVDAAQEGPGLQDEISKGSARLSSEKDESFILQVISFDSLPVTCSRQAEQNHDGSQPEAASTPTLVVNDNMAPSSESAEQSVTTTSHGAAAVSVTSLNYGYGVFKIPK
ncbi:hypothetical protein JRQ81_008276 [Phrynocephalus forsythii]|nr:hypothetical protein JRQ81_008276 [Phrynocephalus forsythii]